MIFKPCHYIGCLNLIEKGAYCEDHKNTKTRPDIRERGYDSLWDKVSKRHKAMKPLCETCLEEDRTMATKISHHIIPEQLCIQIGRKDLIYDYNNLGARCTPCHGKDVEIDKLWFKFAEIDNMQGTAKEIHARFDRWKGHRGG